MEYQTKMNVIKDFLPSLSSFLSALKPYLPLIISLIIPLIIAFLGVGIYAFQQWWKERFLAAHIEQKNIIGEIAVILKMHRRLYDVDYRRLSGIQLPDAVETIPSPNQAEESEKLCR